MRPTAWKVGLRSGPACLSAVSGCTGWSGSDRETPLLTGRSSTQRARRSAGECRRRPPGSRRLGYQPPRADTHVIRSAEAAAADIFAQAVKAA